MAVNGIYVKKEEMEKGIARKTSLRNKRTISLTMTDLLYVEAKCQKNGIYLKGVEEKPKTGYVMKCGPTGEVWLPGSIIDAYSLDEGSFILVRLKENEFFIKKPCSYIPHPPIGELNVDNSFVDIDRLMPVTRFDNEHCKMQTGSSFSLGMIKFPWTMKVTVHMGSCLRIDIARASQEEIEEMPSIQQLRNEYKSNFYGCCADQLAFIYDAGKSKTFPIPKPFRLKAGLSEGSHMDAFVGPEVNGWPSFVFAPPEGTCAIDGAAVDPKKEVPQEIVLCDECDDNIEDLDGLLQRFSKIDNFIDLCMEKIQQQSDEFEKKMTEVQEKLDQSDALNRRLTVNNEMLTAKNKELLKLLAKAQKLVGGEV